MREYCSNELDHRGLAAPPLHHCPPLLPLAGQDYSARTAPGSTVFGGECLSNHPDTSRRSPQPSSGGTTIRGRRRRNVSRGRFCREVKQQRDRISFVRLCPLMYFLKVDYFNCWPLGLFFAQIMNVQPPLERNVSFVPTQVQMDAIVSDDILFVGLWERPSEDCFNLTTNKWLKNPCRY